MCRPPSSPERGAREADDDEVPGALDADLPPVAAAAGDVGRVRALGHDPLEPQRPDLGEEREAVREHVVDEPDGRLSAEDPPQRLLALQQRPRPQVAPVRGQAVEREQGGRVRGRRAGGLRSPGLEALLQPLEAGPPLGVQHDDLAVEDEIAPRKLVEGGGDLREGGGGVEPAAVAQPGTAAVAAGEDPEPVVLDLEDPALAGERGPRARPASARRPTTRTPDS